MWEGLQPQRPGNGATSRRSSSRRSPRATKALAVVATLPLVLLSFLAFGAVAPRVAHAQDPGFTEFPLTSGYDRPLEIVTGPDGNLWFSELTGSNIGTITPSGTITEYPIPNYSGFLGTGGMAVGPDGNLWFTDLSNNTVGKITTAGVITEFGPLQTANAQPEFMTAGPDGNMWFTEQNGADFVGKVTTAGVITEYPVSANASSQQIAAGPDGNVWFAEQGLDRVGRITPSGTLTEFQLAAGAQPAGMVAGPDGNMWVAESGTGIIDEISTLGTVLAQYPILTSNASPQDLVVGPDGNIWFSESGSNTIGRITTAGVITEYSTGESGNPFGITAGPDGNIWYTEYHGDAIGRFALGACGSLSDHASQSPIGTGTAETISVTLSSCGLAQLNATTTTTITPPSECPAAPAIPPFTSSLSYGQTDSHATNFAAPSCPGVYSVSSETTVGSTVMATAQTTYNVLAIGQGIFFSSDSLQSFTNYITTGSDGNLWFTAGGKLYGITPSGTITPYDILPSYAWNVTAGADGNLYVASAGSSIAQVSIGGRGGPRFVWQVPAAGNNYINDLEPGVDGNMWFVAGQSGQGSIGYVTPAATVKHLKLPAGAGAPGSITAGPDNAMWFTLDSGNVGRITTTGAVTLFAVPPGNNGAGGIALGPDGNFWITSGRHSGDGVSPNYVLKMTPAGVFTTFVTPSGDSGIAAITPAADGNVWANEPWLDRGLNSTPGCPTYYGGGVARISPAGVITEYASSCTDFNDSFNIVSGPDGNVWNAAYYERGIDMTEIGASTSCTAIASSTNPVSVAHGSAETISTAITNCASALRLMKLETKTVPPSGCGSATTTHETIPVQPRVGTTFSSTFNAPACAGTYKVISTLITGKTVIAKATTTYQVT